MHAKILQLDITVQISALWQFYWETERSSETFNGLDEFLSFIT